MAAEQKEAKLSCSVCNRLPCDHWPNVTAQLSARTGPLASTRDIYSESSKVHTILESDQAQEQKHISLSMSDVAKALEPKKNQISVQRASALNQFVSWLSCNNFNLKDNLTNE